MTLTDTVTLTQSVADRRYLLRPTPAWVGTRTRNFDQRTCQYGFDQAVLRAPLMKLGAARQGGTVKITCVGDSTTTGSGATALTSWPMQLRALLSAAGFPIKGTGIAYASTGVTDTRWSSTGTVSGFGMYAQLSAAASKTFVSDQVGTSVDIWYFNTSTSSFTYQIDGGSPVTVVPTGASTIGSVTVTGLASATHTVKVTAGTGTCFYIGTNVYLPTGVQITNAGVPASKVADWKTTTTITNFKQATAETPDLFFVALGINDSAGGTGLGTFTADLTTVVTNLQAIAPVVLCVQHNASGTPSANHQPYAKAIYDVADTKNTMVLDLFNRWGSYFNLNTFGMTADSIHLNTKGYADWAQLALRVLQ